MRLIDADALMNFANNHKDKTIDSNDIARFPTATDERKIANGELAEVLHAHWDEDGEIQTCSNCGEEHEWQDYRAAYCEDCGAKMDAKQ